MIHLAAIEEQWKPKKIETALKESVYADKKSWSRFLDLFLLGLGFSFVISGIIFFFAYNWTDLPKFAKLGIIEFLLLLSISLSLLTKWRVELKGTLLMGAAFLTGALFAIFGQIYQTGADAYNLFMGWAIFIAIWTFVSNFPPLWMLFILLINTTLLLYKEQLPLRNTEVNQWLNNSISLFNTLSILVAELLHHKGMIKKRTAWFIHTILILTAGSVSINMIVTILDPSKNSLITWVVGGILLIGGIVYGLKGKRFVYIATALFSVILVLGVKIINSNLFSGQGDTSIFLLTGIYFIVSTTGLILWVINLKKRWSHEQ